MGANEGTGRGTPEKRHRCVVNTLARARRRRCRTCHRCQRVDLLHFSLKETTGPTEGSQHRGSGGGPTNSRAAACRYRPAASLSMANILNQGQCALGSLLGHLTPPFLFFTKVPLLSRGQL